MDTLILNDEKVDFYHAHGYLSLEQLSPEEELHKLIGIYDELFANHAGRNDGNEFDLAGTDEDGKQAALPQILRPSKYAPELKETFLFANAFKVAQRLLGADAQLNGEHAILKPAGYGAATPWHQDEAYWDPTLEYTTLSIWIPFQEATVENGCLHFVPGSHKLEVLPHHSIGHDPRVHGLEVDQADTSGAVSCELCAGAATVHNSKTLHYAGPNTSPTPRRAYILTFGLAPQKRTIPRRFAWNEIKTTARLERAQTTVQTSARPER